MIGKGASVTELLARLQAANAALDVGSVQGALDDLERMGLVSRSERLPPRYTMTSLGRAALESTLAGEGLATKLRELERLRKDLLVLISHEFRTPLTAIKTSIGLLLDTTLSPDERQTQQLLETVERNTYRMQHLVTVVLDIAAQETGKIHLQLRRFDACELAREAAASVMPLTLEHTQSVTLTLPSGPVWVYGDHRALAGALVNLVSNAQKYSPDGAPITVSVESDRDEVRWIVTDQGPGIPAEYRSRIFERFSMREVDGPRLSVGLGLPTALRMAKAHGGRIDVTSEPGKGSTFTLAVPAGGPMDEESPTV